MNHIIKIQSHLSVKESIDKLESILKEKGLSIFARINHTVNAQNISLELNDSEVLIFGNPKAGTLLIQDNIEAGLDLPLKIYAYQDHQGKNWISYRNGSSLKKIHNFSDPIQHVIEMIDQSLENFSKAISK